MIIMIVSWTWIWHDSMNGQAAVAGKSLDFILNTLQIFSCQEILSLSTWCDFQLSHVIGKRALRSLSLSYQKDWPAWYDTDYRMFSFTSCLTSLSSPQWPLMAMSASSGWVWQRQRSHGMFSRDTSHIEPIYLMWLSIMPWIVTCQNILLFQLPK